MIALKLITFFLHVTHRIQLPQNPAVKAKEQCFTIKSNNRWNMSRGNLKESAMEMRWMLLKTSFW